MIAHDEAALRRRGVVLMADRALCRCFHRIGRRGCALLIFAFIDLLYGVSLLDLPDATARADIYVWAATLLPLTVWASVWLVVSGVLVISAFRRADALGYGVAIGIKVAWAALLLGGQLAGQVPRGYVAMAIWLGLAGLVALIASWPEPRRKGDLNT